MKKLFPMLTCYFKYNLFLLFINYIFQIYNLEQLLLLHNLLLMKIPCLVLRSDALESPAASSGATLAPSFFFLAEFQIVDIILARNQ